jgi:hypothetical protein
LILEQAGSPARKKATKRSGTSHTGKILHNFCGKPAKELEDKCRNPLILQLLSSECLLGRQPEKPHIFGEYIENRISQFCPNPTPLA